MSESSLGIRRLRRRGKEAGQAVIPRLEGNGGEQPEVTGPTAQSRWSPPAHGARGYGIFPEASLAWLGVSVHM